jgi:hypothetical protein
MVYLPHGTGGVSGQLDLVYLMFRRTNVQVGQSIAISTEISHRPLAG